MSFAFIFDATDPTIETIGDYSLVPEGRYVATIIEAQVKPSANNPNQQALELKWRIDQDLDNQEQKYTGKTFYTSYWFAHEKAQTREIAQKFIKNICMAVNVLQTENTQQFVGKYCGIVVAIQKSKDPKYKDKNRIVRAFSLDDSESTIVKNSVWG